MSAIAGLRVERSCWAVHFGGAAGCSRYLTASDPVCAELLPRLWRTAVLDTKVIAPWLTSPG